MAQPKILLSGTSFAILTLGCFGAPAFAALPDAAKVMITNAAREGDASDLVSVVKLARKSFPEDSAEIDTLLLSLESPKGEGGAPPIATTTTAQSAVVAAAEAVEPKAPEPVKPVVKWSGRGDLGGFQTTGNTDSFGVTLGGSLTRKSENVSHQLRLRGDYQESEGKKSREFINAAYQGDWTISPKHYALGIVEYERDVLAGVDHRTTTSLGLGWRAVDDGVVKIALEAGPAYRHQWYSDGLEESNIAGRGALTSSWQMNDKVKLSQDMELVTQNTNNTLRAITSLQAKLTGRISSQISYDLRYQDHPLLGKEDTDTITRVGIVYDF